METNIKQLIENKRQELLRKKKEKLLFKLGLYERKQIQKDEYIGGVNYPKVTEEITYFDVTDEDLKPLVELQHDLDLLENGKTSVPASTSETQSKETTPIIASILSILGFGVIILSSFVSLPYFDNPILSYVGIQLLVSGIVSGLLLIGFGFCIRYLSEIAEQTRR
jgi:hypothetical protein